MPFYTQGNCYTIDRGDQLTTERVLIIPDTHTPYEDKDAFALVMHVATAWKPDLVIILGDFVDFYSVSQHDKDPRRKEWLDDELSYGNKQLNKIEALNARVIYCEGNHEFRLQRYVWKNAPQLAALVKTDDLLRVGQRGWTWVPYRDHHEINGAHVTHDIGDAGINAARKLAGIYHGSALIGHTHRGALEYEGTIFGDWFVTGMFGWLGDKERLDYQHRAKNARWYVTGFGTAHIVGGRIYPQFHPITLSKQCVVDGVVYEI